MLEEIEISGSQHRYAVLWRLCSDCSLSSDLRGSALVEMDTIKAGYAKEDWKVFEDYLPSVLEIIEHNTAEEEAPQPAYAR